MKKIETLLNIDLGQKFDTRKGLNRSEKNIPLDIIDRLEAGEFSCEMINELSKQFPIFRYRTCITIHGNWGEIRTSSVGRYTNVIQNQNGSTEIKYSAIDRDKIHALRSLLATVKSGFYFHENSSERYFYKSINTRDADQFQAAVKELKPIAERIKDANIYGYANLYASPTLYGGVDVVLQIHVLSIPQGENENFCYLLTGTDAETFKVLQAEKIAAEQAKEKEYELQRIANQHEAEAKKALAEPYLNEMRAKLIEQGYVLESKTNVEQNKVYIKISFDTDKMQPSYHAFKFTKEKGQKKWRYEDVYSNEISFDFTEKSYYLKPTIHTVYSGYVKQVEPTTPIKKEVIRVEPGNVKTVIYSEKCIAIYGDTKPIKEQLKEAGARFNPFLTIEGIKQAGWVLPITQQNKIAFLNQ